MEGIMERKDGRNNEKMEGIKERWKEQWKEGRKKGMTNR